MFWNLKTDHKQINEFRQKANSNQNEQCLIIVRNNFKSLTKKSFLKLPASKINTVLKQHLLDE